MYWNGYLHVGPDEYSDIIEINNISPDKASVYVHNYHGAPYHLYKSIEIIVHWNVKKDDRWEPFFTRTFEQNVLYGTRLSKEKEKEVLENSYKAKHQ